MIQKLARSFAIGLALTAGMLIGPVSAADRSADLAAFRTEFFEIDKSYSASNRAAAETMLASLEADADNFSDAAFELALAEIVAKADNGHTIFFTGFWQQKFNRIPLKLLLIGEQLYVGDADDAHHEFIGAQITHIGVYRFPTIRDALASYQGGLPGWRSQFVYFFLESPEILHAAGLIDDSNSLTITGVNRRGEEFETTIIAQSGLPFLEGFEVYIPPSRLIEFMRGADAPAFEERPLYLRNDADDFWIEWLEDDIIYIQYKANRGEARGIDVSTFSDNIIAELRARPPRHIILDQRFNTGGDLNTTRSVMQTLPELIESGGNIYTIVSGRTFSAGISSVGYLKQAGGDRVIIVGEPIGDRLEFWAEGDAAALPQSGAAILYATERHNYMTGCQEVDCHGSIKRNPIRVETLDPDFLAPLTHEDFLNANDPAMEMIISLIDGSG